MSILSKFFKSKNGAGKVARWDDLCEVDRRVAEVAGDLRALEDNCALRRDLNLFYCFVLSEARVSDRWDEFVFHTNRFKLTGCGEYVSIGDLKREVSEAGYDFSRLLLKSNSDVFSLLAAVRVGLGVAEFCYDEVLKKGSSS